MNPHTLQDLAALVGQADCALVAATSGRGIDGHGHRLPDLDANLDRALAALSARRAVRVPVGAQQRGEVAEGV